MSLPDRPSSFWGPVLGSPVADTLAERHEVVVVGAGIVGLSTALLLAERGVDVAVVEARKPGAGTTGRSTAKATLLQGTRLGQIRATHGREVAQAYLTANRTGQAFVQRVVDDSQDVDHDVRDCWTYATSAQGARSVTEEHAALVDLGVPAVMARTDELPYPTEAAVRLGGQLQMNPVQYLAALEGMLAQLGVPVVWPYRVADLEQVGEDIRVSSTEGRTVAARWVVLATLLPFPRRTLVFANSSPSRSHTITCRVPGSIPQGMYLSADSPTRSLRTARSAAGEEILMVGGNGHPTGKKNPTRRHLEDLAEWAASTFGATEVTHRWSAQDFTSVDLLPQIGHSPLGPRGLLIATGMGKWGMTNGPAAAHILTDIVTGEQQPWAAALQPRWTGSASGARKLATLNLKVGFDLVKGWTTQPRLRATPSDGEGAVRRHVPQPEAVTAAGDQRRVCSAVCTHLGGIVAWNDADRTWDCPLHGSVFAADGGALEGPAVHGLADHDAVSSGEAADT